MDHMDVLGDTLDAIGLEKSGIYRHQKPAFFGSKNPPESLLKYSKSIDTKLQIFGTDFGVNCKENGFDVWCKNKTYFSLPYPALRGEIQTNNVALSLAILNELHIQFPLSTGMIKTGLLQTKLFGRFQVLPGSPQIILDVAHNPHSVTTMIANMLKLPFAAKSVAVFGISSDKDADEVIKLCKQFFDKWFIAKTNSIKATNSEDIAKILIRQGVAKQNIIECDSISNAYQQASLIDNARIICFGSFLVVEEAYKIIEINRQQG